MIYYDFAAGIQMVPTVILAQSKDTEEFLEEGDNDVWGTFAVNFRTEEFLEEGDDNVWGTFAVNFRQVLSVLDRNRALIQQINEKHQSKIHENLVKNVAGNGKGCELALAVRGLGMQRWEI
ncbi:hypothetical protein U1Q18_027139 [Sarracenia purpurea var. burkii]